MKKIILPGIVAGIAKLIIGMAIGYLFMAFPSVAADYKNPTVMRQWQDPLMMLFFVYPFIAGIIYAWAWDKSKKLFKGTSWERGTYFGLSIFLIATVPGMFVTYTTMPYSFMTVISCTVEGLIDSVVAGWIFAKMNK